MCAAGGARAAGDVQPATCLQANAATTRSLRVLCLTVRTSANASTLSHSAAYMSSIAGACFACSAGKCCAMASSGSDARHAATDALSAWRSLTSRSGVAALDATLAAVANGAATDVPAAAMAGGDD